MQLVCLLSKMAPAESLLKGRAASPKEGTRAFLRTILSSSLAARQPPTAQHIPPAWQAWSRSWGCVTGALWLRPLPGKAEPMGACTAGTIHPCSLAPPLIPFQGLHHTLTLLKICYETVEIFGYLSNMHIEYSTTNKRNP